MTTLTTEQLRSALLTPALSSEWRSRGSAALAITASVLAAIGLFTVSWERIGNLAVGPYNVKLPVVALSLAALCALPASSRLRSAWRAERLFRAVAVLAVVVLFLLVLASVVSSSPTAGAAQIVAVLTGAVLPAVAVVVLIDSRATLVWALRWFVAGAVLASVFGLYQLLAFYAGLPQFVVYTGTGVNGVIGRIAAFSYEPAYFAIFMLLAFGAAASLAQMRGGVLGWLPAAWFAVVLALANVRALLFLVPLLALLLALRWRRNRRLLLRAVVVGALVVATNGVATSVAFAVVEAQREAAVARAVPADEVPPDEVPPDVLPPRELPPLVPPVEQRGDAPQNILNPNEQSSNAPRLELYGAVLRIALEHPILGVGPGGLASALADDGYVPANQSDTVVANNIWLQALVDGGVGLLLAEVGLAVIAVLLMLRRSLAEVQPLLAAWVAVILVSGMLTSYFFDLKMWVVLGLGVAAALVLRPDRPDGVNSRRTPAAP